MTCKCKQLKAYIEQEKFNWTMDRKRADGAEAALAEMRRTLKPVYHVLGIEHLGQLKSTVFALKDQLVDAEEMYEEIKKAAIQGQTKGHKIISDLKKELAELRKFVMDVTLFLQKHAHHDMEKIEPMFQRAYRLYVKYDVENRGT